MNVKRFTAKTSREALRLVREALGEDAVVLSTKPSAGGVEVLAMPPDGLGHLESAPGAAEVPVPIGSRPAADLKASSAEQDAARLEMSTLSFQDYVRTRMLKRRRAAIDTEQADSQPPQITIKGAAPSRLDLRADDVVAFPDEPARPAAPATGFGGHAAAESALEREVAGVLEQRMNEECMHEERRQRADAQRSQAAAARASVPTAADETARADAAARSAESAVSLRRESALIEEMRSMKGLIEERFGALAFMERLQRRPGEARLTQKLLDCGFSPMLVRKIADGLGDQVADEAAWAAQILEHNLQAAAAGEAIEEQNGVFALIGATGVGKTTTTAKIAAAFAARHGAGQLGLVTLDAYRVGAHEQLRAYGRILGVPVHTAHDRASLEDLLELLSAKKLVLIDTAGMAQRDARTRELLEMLSHARVRRVLVVNAAAQGETTEDVLVAYRASTCSGIVLSKLDEAVKLGPALDAAIRHRLKIVGIANGQRVPEDWHRLSANALVQRALRGGGSPAWRLDAAEMQLVFAAPHGERAAAAAAC